ncbi:MAG: Rpn family recombination-promoting nuclease/putative transposase [Campylobacterales bacterium]|nr:Rpn family recombination-promoting nuclease/putative transposase [Campylobacterales bacterium]
MKKDITTKETIKAITEDIAIYILGLDISDVEFVDKELQRVEKREADIVATCKIDGIESILHLEIQNDNDKTMHQRMLRYYSDIIARFEHLPIYQYVVYIGKAKLTMQECIHNDQMDYRYSLIDMHTIDCEKFLQMDTPDALVLSILCDFKGKDEFELLMHLTSRLKTLTGDDEHRFGKYMLMMETLSENRDLKEKLKKAEEMLRTITMEQLPSYELGMERGMREGELKGKLEGKLETAKTMIKEFGHSAEEIAKKLDLSLDLLLKYLKH